jgi:hypothetical protein
MCYEVNWPYGYLCMYGQDIVLKYVRVYCIYRSIKEWKPPYQPKQLESDATMATMQRSLLVFLPFAYQVVA